MMNKLNIGKSYTHTQKRLFNLRWDMKKVLSRTHFTVFVLCMTLQLFSISHILTSRLDKIKAFLGFSNNTHSTFLIWYHQIKPGEVFLYTFIISWSMSVKCKMTSFKISFHGNFCGSHPYFLCSTFHQIFTIYVHITKTKYISHLSKSRLGLDDN